MITVAIIKVIAMIACFILFAIGLKMSCGIPSELGPDPIWSCGFTRDWLNEEAKR